MIINAILQSHGCSYDKYNIFQGNKTKDKVELNHSKAADLSDVSTALLLLSVPFVMSTFNKNEKYNKKDYFGIFLLVSSLIFQFQVQ